jgi:hypothetical protein
MDKILEVAAKRYNYIATLFRENYSGEDDGVIDSVSKVEEILRFFNLHEELYNQMRCDYV